MTPPLLILASGSPRRAKLLRDAGYVFEQVDSGLDEEAASVPGLSPRQLASTLAYHKASIVAERVGSGVVIGCDTLLDMDGRVIGKPKDESDARNILKAIVGHTHRVVTAVVLLDAQSKRQSLFVESADVTIGVLTVEEIAAYLRSGEWKGKTGGYNLAELEDRWRFTLRGDPTTVVGLPMRRLAEELRTFAPG